tara:strand:+ start:4104 stop:4958 length:855 start_codon:yes stop_codon:yes gene_type:complete
MEQHSNLRSEFLNRGFILVRSLYNKNRIRELRNICIKNSNNNNEILSFDFTKELLLHPKLISIVKQILNSEKILYYSDSNIINHEFPFEAKNGFHNDSRFEDENIPFKEEYPLVRVGIYFEDYKKYSGGLKIKEKSHKYFSFNLRAKLENSIKLFKILLGKSRYDYSSLRLGKKINLDLEEGDVVIWNLRTHHCGVSRRLKLFKNLCLQPDIEKIIPKMFFLPTQYEKNRCSIFSTFAKNDLKNKNILNYVKNKCNSKKIDQLKKDATLVNKLSELGVIIPRID